MYAYLQVKTLLCSLEQKLFNIEIPQNKYNLTREEPSALYNLKNDTNIVINVLIRVPRLLFGIGMVILRRTRNNLEIKIFTRRCVMIPDLLEAS